LRGARIALHHGPVNYLRVAATVAVITFAFGLTLFVRVWLRERHAKTVFPASQSALLLQPTRRLIHRPREMIATFGLRPGDRVLELGPGPGYFTSEAASAVGDSGSLVAADLQPAMIEQLLRRLTPDPASRVRALACDAMQLPFNGATFDAAFLVTVLGEIPEPDRALAELKRILRPGGIVSFCEHLGDPDYVREGALRRLCWDAGLQFVDRRRQPLGYIMRFTRPRDRPR
jgi:ubiquinone/menaquinone biosynthesis C-methylase UbiE